MKQTKKGQKKVCYFPKDYAPARALANQKKSRKASRKKSSTFVAKVKTSACRTAQVSQKFAQKLQKSGHQAWAKVTKTPSSRQFRSTASRRTRTNRVIPAKPKRFSWREVTLMSLIGTCAVMIAFTLVFAKIADPAQRGQKELEKLAKAYYIEYLYPNALGSKLHQPEAILADYTAQGLPSVRLRQLLLYNNGKHADSVSVFDNPYYQCDLSQTYVRYYPVEPYGPYDYTAVYGTACEKPGIID